MERRELLGIAGAAGLGLVGLQAWAEDDRPDHLHHGDKTQESCLKSCTACATTCNEAARHCLSVLASGTPDSKHHARTHALAAECADFCMLSATMIARGSELMLFSCTACAEACRTCAEACEKATEPTMRECAVNCRECERTCREMVRTMSESAKGTR